MNFCIVGVTLLLSAVVVLILDDYGLKMEQVLFLGLLVTGLVFIVLAFIHCFIKTKEGNGGRQRNEQNAPLAVVVVRHAVVAVFQAGWFCYQYI